MNIRSKTSLQNMKSPPKTKSGKAKMDSVGSRVAEKGHMRRIFNKDRKIALQQDVDKLKKKLRHEENVHRALERAFTRPLGALPRLPPYLPQYTLELLAEVAVLEEEVVRLEKQVVNCRQGLYQEAVYISSSKKQAENGATESAGRSPDKPVKSERSSSEASPNAPVTKANGSSLLRQSSVGSESNLNGFSSNRMDAGKQALNRCSLLDGKENQLQSTRSKQIPQKITRPRTLIKQACIEQRSNKKQEVANKMELNFDADQEKSYRMATVGQKDSTQPTKLSEDILRCLLGIFLKLGKQSTGEEPQGSSVVSRVAPSGVSERSNGGYNTRALEQLEFRDPYGVCAEFGERDVGQYKYLSEVSAGSIDLSRVSNAAHLIRRMKQLLVKLGLVDLRGLTHQQRLAFWINIYNSCMMNAFLELGIPDSPHTIVSLMRKAVLNVGGHTLNALTIEHFILRLPCHSKYTHSKGGKNDELTMWSVFGLDWPEPLVTFALSCGSWSSPAVRVYTPTNIEDELEAAKKEYLQAAIGISTESNKLAIPKLLDWYLLDFAKDVDSLLDWICLQLPSDLRKEAVKCLEKGRKDSQSQAVQIMPYEFSFRYLFAT